LTSKDQDNILLQALIDARSEKDQTLEHRTTQKKGALHRIAAAVTGKVDVRRSL